MSGKHPGGEDLERIAAGALRDHIDALHAEALDDNEIRGQRPAELGRVMASETRVATQSEGRRP